MNLPAASGGEVHSKTIQDKGSVTEDKDHTGQNRVTFYKSCRILPKIEFTKI